MVQPYPLYLAWTETAPGQDEPTREHHAAQILGWTYETASDGDTLGPMPVVIHPDTKLPATVGFDTAGSVSAMLVDTDFAVVTQYARSRELAERGPGDGKSPRVGEQAAARAARTIAEYRDLAFARGDEIANLSRELSDVLGDVRALLDHPDEAVRDVARAALRKRIGGGR